MYETARTDVLASLALRRGAIVVARPHPHRTQPGQASARLANINNMAAPVEAVDKLLLVNIAESAADFVAEQLCVERALVGAQRQRQQRRAGAAQPLPRARADALQTHVPRAVRRQRQRHVVPRDAVIF